MDVAAALDPPLLLFPNIVSKQVDLFFRKQAHTMQNLRFHVLLMFVYNILFCKKISELQKSYPEVFLRKGFLKNMQQIYKKTSMPKLLGIGASCSDDCSPVSLLHIFRTPFPKNTSGWLFLQLIAMRALIDKFGLFTVSSSVVVSAVSVTLESDVNK